MKAAKGLAPLLESSELVHAEFCGLKMAVE